MSNNGELSGQKEKVAAGILGAVLFALIGGIIYVALYKADIFPPLSGLAAAALSRHDAVLRPLGARLMTGGGNDFYKKIGYTDQQVILHFHK